MENTLGSGTSVPRGRGRPTVVDAEKVAEVAFRLWAEHGYRTTGWQEIADATGVSVRTLIRRFGSRSEIPWVGVPAATERLAASLASAPAAASLGAALRQAVVESVTHAERISRVAPDWLALVGAEPELLAAAPRAYQPWIEEIAAFIVRREPRAPREICLAVATAYQAATFSALVQWAESGADEGPDEAVERMLRWLDIHPPVDGDGATTER